MPYIAYNTTSKLITRTGTSRLSAKTGETRPDRNFDEINVEANTDWYYFSSAPNLRQEYPPSLDKLKEVAWNLHHWLVSQADLAQASRGKYYPNIDINFVEDLEWRTHQGVNAVLTGRLTVDTALTLAQKITFCEEMIKGGTDAADVYALLDALPALRQASLANEITHPIVWVNPTTGTRVATTAARALSGADGLNLQPPTTHLRDGAWINNLTA